MKARVSSRSSTESHSIFSAAGAIWVYGTFTQSGGTLKIANSLAKLTAGAVHIGAPSGEFRDVASAGFEAVVCCGRFILVVVFRLRTSCLMAFLAQRFPNKSFREEVANSQIAALKNRCWYADNCDFQLTCQVEQCFHVFSILDHLDALKVKISSSSLAESYSILLGHRSHFGKEQLRPVWWHVEDRQLIGKVERRRGAPWSAFGRVSRCRLSWLWGCGMLW